MNADRGRAVPEPRAVRSVWFDLDDTLYDFQAMMRQALLDPLRRIHEDYPHTRASLGVEEMVRVREEVSEGAGALGLSLEQMRLQAFRETLARYAEPDDRLADELQQMYLAARFRDVAPFPDVRPCLAALKDRYVLGLLSNGNTMPEQLGLERAFRFFVFSEQVGVRKPDRRIFRHAAALADCAPQECIYVGDRPEDDVMGAVRAGWHAVWLNRNSKPWPLVSHEPHLQIRDLTELPDLLPNGSTAN